MSTFSTFAPDRAPATYDEVVAWFSFMAAHSNVPHPDDSAVSIAWSTADLARLFSGPERRIHQDRYDRAMGAAFALCAAAGVDIYDLAGGTCTCGHDFDQHQTGSGAWTGFCSGTLGQLGGEYLTPGADPNEPCACEAPVVGTRTHVADTDTALRAHLDFCAGGEFCTLDDCLCDCHHSHIEAVEWRNGLPVCGRCDLVLEVAGDALVVPS